MITDLSDDEIGLTKLIREGKKFKKVLTNNLLKSNGLYNDGFELFVSHDKFVRGVGICKENCEVFFIKYNDYSKLVGEMLYNKMKNHTDLFTQLFESDSLISKQAYYQFTKLISNTP